MRQPADDATFEELFRETCTDLLAYVLRRSKTAEDAADLLAETYLIAWRKLERVPSGDAARLWLFAVARNLLRQGARRRRSSNRLTERLAGELRLARPAHPSDDEDRDRIRAALAALPERDREIVMLTAWEGLTPSQIAAVTGMSANVVRVRLHRARNRLKRALSPSRPASRAGYVAVERDG